MDSILEDIEELTFKLEILTNHFVKKGTPVRTLKISYKTTNLCQEMV